MSKSAQLKRKAAEFEQKRQYDRALTTYAQAIEAAAGIPDELDIPLYNRVGDLHLRMGELDKAVAYYETAVDLYAEGGFFNNAIALCNKVLRHSPGRASVYYKLGKISAQKGFRSDAKQNFLEYADRMQKAGKIDEAFRALNEFADLCPDQDDIRLMLADQLSRLNRRDEAVEQLQLLYERYHAEGRTAEAAATAERMRTLDPSAQPRAATGVSRKSTAELVFLDLDEAAAEPAVPEPAPEPRRPSMPTPAVLPASRTPAEPMPAPPAQAAAEPMIEPTMEPMIIEPTAEPTIEPMIIEPTSLETGPLDPEPAAPETDDADSGVIAEPLEIEHTSLTSDLPVSIAPTPLADLEPTAFAAPEPAEASETQPLEIVGRPTPSSLTEAVGTLDLLEPMDGDTDEAGETHEAQEADAADAADEADEADAGGGGDLVFILPDDEPAPAPPEVGRRSTMFAAQSVEILKAAVEGEPDDWSLRRELAEAMLEAGDRLGGIQHLEIAMAGADASGDLDLAASLATELARLEPETIQHHQKRVEFAFRANDRPRLVEAYLSLADALLRAELPEKATAAYQRVLEIAPDESRALAAIEALAPPEIVPPAPGRTSQPVTARVSQPVTARVSQPVRRSGAIAQPPAPKSATPPSPSPGPTRMPLSPTRAGGLDGAGAPAITEPPRIPTRPTPRQTAPNFATPTQAPAPVPAAPRAATPAPAPASPPAADDDFVNLGDWLRDSEAPRDTRMVVEEKEPTGDEDADFADMLRKFKQGVAENVEADDYQSHYDLGIAYKEMGLVDEAIYEFQRALGGTQNRVATYEALGDCFLDKNQFTLATSILSRALAEQGTSEDQLVGVLYLLGCAAEAQDRTDEALAYYHRVFLQDIQFRDVAERVAELERAAR